MTNKRKKRARSISNKTGMPHQSAVNALENSKPGNCIPREIADQITGAYLQSAAGWEKLVAASQNSPAHEATLLEFLKKMAGRTIPKVANLEDLNQVTDEVYVVPSFEELCATLEDWKCELILREVVGVAPQETGEMPAHKLRLKIVSELIKSNAGWLKLARSLKGSEAKKAQLIEVFREIAGEKAVITTDVEEVPTGTPIFPMMVQTLERCMKEIQTEDGQEALGQGWLTNPLEKAYLSADAQLNPEATSDEVTQRTWENLTYSLVTSEDLAIVEAALNLAPILFNATYLRNRLVRQFQMWSVLNAEVAQGVIKDLQQEGYVFEWDNYAAGNSISKGFRASRLVKKAPDQLVAMVNWPHFGKPIRPFEQDQKLPLTVEQQLEYLENAEASSILVRHDDPEQLRLGVMVYRNNFTSIWIRVKLTDLKRADSAISERFLALRERIPQSLADAPKEFPKVIGIASYNESREIQGVRDAHGNFTELKPIAGSEQTSLDLEISNGRTVNVRVNPKDFDNLVGRFESTESEILAKDLTEWLKPTSHATKVFS